MLCSRYALSISGHLTFPVDESTLLRCGVHAPVFPIIKEEIPVCLPVESAFDAVLFNQVGEPEELLGSPTLFK